MVSNLLSKNPSAWKTGNRFASGKQFMLFFLFFFVTATIQAQSELAVDINKVPTRESGNYKELTSTGALTFYVDVTYYNDAYESSHLWRTDGTKEGTFMLMSYDDIHSLTPLGNRLYFVAKNYVSGEELYVTDGSIAGTTQVKDIASAFASSSSPQELTVVNTNLFFTATDGVSGRELYKTNGTTAGTVRVKDILKVSGSSNPTDLTNINGILYFNANDGMNGYELWKSDGSDAGTVMVKDIRTGSKLSSSPKELTNVNGTLYFTATDGTTGRELYKSNGTAAGTVLIKDIRTGSADSAPDNLTAVGSTLYFGAFASSTGRELWKSNGTSTGTILVKDITPGTGSYAGGGYPHLSYFTIFNGSLYFMAYTDRPRVWKTNGTAAGTIPISPLNTNFIEINPNLTVFNGALYYVDNGSQGPAHGFMELWKTNGNPGGEQLVRNDLGVWTNKDMELTPSGDKMFFTTWNDYSGTNEKLWFTDGTPSGTMPVDLSRYNYGSFPTNITTVGTSLYFMANNGTNEALYRSDGTEAGTQLVKVINGGTTNYFYAAGNALYFIRSDAQNVLWKSDGTDAGTIPLKELSTGGLTKIEYEFVNDKLFVSVYTYTSDGGTTSALWTSDGTPAGTITLRSFPDYIHWLDKSGSVLLFGANDGTNGYELWKSDGTIDGTTLLKDVHPGSVSGTSTGLSLNGVVYFLGNAGTDTGYDLWRSDGTLAGTYLVKDGSFNGFSKSKTLLFFFTSVDGPEYFTTESIWKSDGTTTGTQKVEDLPAEDTNDGSPHYKLVFNGGDQFYFIKGSGYGQHILFKSDGTPEGTGVVKDLGVYESLAVDDYAFIGSKLYYLDKREGFILRTDGTSCGTTSIPTSSEAIGGMTFDWMNLDAYNGKIYYANYDPAAQEELFSFTDNIAPCEMMMAQGARQPAPAATMSSVEKIEIGAYPNPFNNEITLNIPGDENKSYHLNVMTTDGKMHDQFSDLRHNQNYKIGSQWAPGIYFLKIIKENEMTVKKVIKTN
jgi:ELWxxDGT repeat protein